MVSIRNILLILTILLSGCSKISYILKQAKGQLSLINNSRENSEVLADVKIPYRSKEKIKKIIAYKEYFYSFFSREPKDIYSRTRLLNRDAVTYLVIGSPIHKIEAIESCFPFLGCFPYLGFFEEKDAISFTKTLEKEGSSFWVRKVYAYSTLGYFSDPILSSFFEYDDFDLAELIFHELFHTIFFVKGEVDLNENLANFFAKKMKDGYFSNASEKLLKKKADDERHSKLRSQIVLLTKELDILYSKDSSEPQKILSDFLSNRFFPVIKHTCQRLKIKNCSALSQQWNNAHFAAFLTYEAKKDDIDKLFLRLGLDLKEFFHYIKDKYDEFLKSDQRGSFETYLFNRST